MTPFYRFASRGAIIPFLKLVSRQHVSGTENIPREGGFIAVCNHLSDLDSLTAMRCLVDEDVPVYSLAKSTIFDVPILGHVFKAGGQIPVYRGTKEAGNSLVEAERRLLAGDVIMIFPEGTLSRDPLLWPCAPVRACCPWGSGGRRTSWTPTAVDFIRCPARTCGL